MSRRPRIGITAGRRRGRIMTLLNRFSVWSAGGWPVVLMPGGRKDPRGLDGFVIGGGDDIDVALYDGGPELQTRIDPERDELELAVLDHADLIGAPVLGICRGAQMLNVHAGGTLHRDVHAVFEELPRMRTVLARKCVDIEEDSLLARLLAARQTTVNALHHQAVDQLGRGLRICARDEHGVVQGIEHPEDPLRLGVQWHPEFLFYHGRQRQLFRALVSAAARLEDGRAEGTETRAAANR